MDIFDYAAHKFDEIDVSNRLFKLVTGPALGNFLSLTDRRQAL